MRVNLLARNNLYNRVSVVDVTECKGYHEDNQY